jgi:hypothetical protein
MKSKKVVLTRDSRDAPCAGDPCVLWKENSKLQKMNNGVWDTPFSSAGMIEEMGVETVRRLFGFTPRAGSKYELIISIRRPQKRTTKK